MIAQPHRDLIEENIQLRKEKQNLEAIHRDKVQKLEHMIQRQERVIAEQEKDIAVLREKLRSAQEAGRQDMLWKVSQDGC